MRIPMNNAHLNHLFLIILLCILFPIIHSTCPSSKCSNSGPIVRFPFHLHHQNDSYYPGFNLSCNTQALTILSLPNSGDFYVRNIDYYYQQVILYDPQDCTPNRLMNLNLSSSPFDVNYYCYRNYTFLSCPTDLVSSRRYASIDCLSNSTTSVLATFSRSLAEYMLTISCTIISTVPIPISWPYDLYDQNGFTSGLNQDFRLEWNISGCTACERAGGICQVNLSANHEQQLGCLANCQPGPSPNDIRVFKLVVLCFTIPVVTFTVIIAMYFCYIDQRRQHRHWVEPHAARTMHQTTFTPNGGLDDMTIESYAKIVVGESKRIPGPNDIACPIFLADYCPKDTLRSIPECLHCFHADCIDEWLRSNPTCPVCRNSPSHA